MQTRASLPRTRGQAGFTLIELLVVVAILTVLAGVAVAAVGSLTDDATDNACAVEDRTVRTAASAYDTAGGTVNAVGDLVTAGYLDDASTLGSYSFSSNQPTQTACP